MYMFTDTIPHGSYDQLTFCYMNRAKQEGGGMEREGEIDMGVHEQVFMY